MTLSERRPSVGLRGTVPRTGRSRGACSGVVAAAVALVLGAACDRGRALWEPRTNELAQPAPDSFVVSLETSAGELQMTLNRPLSPLAVDRLYYLARHSFYDGARFYRVNEQYAQFGYSGVPALDSLWEAMPIPDEPVRASNVRGSVSFARMGPRSRSFVLFVNLDDNAFLDAYAGDGVAGFPPVGRVSSGMEVADALYGGYGDAPMLLQDSITARGGDFLRSRFPRLDSIIGTRVVQQW